MKKAIELFKDLQRVETLAGEILNSHLERIQSMAEKMFSGKKHAFNSVKGGFFLILPVPVRYNEDVPDLGQGKDMITEIHTKYVEAEDKELKIVDAVGEELGIVVSVSDLRTNEVIRIIQQLEKIKEAQDILIG